MNKDKEPLLSAEQYFRNNYSSTYIERERVAYLNDVVDCIKEYAKYHTEWHLNNVKEVVCEEVNLEHKAYKENGDFISDNIGKEVQYDENFSNNYIGIDKQSITNAVYKYIEDCL